MIFVITLICFLFPCSVHSQSYRSITNDENFSHPYRSIGAVIENYINLPFYKAARTFPLFILNPGDNWSSTSVNYFKEDHKLTALPFGFQTPDLLPPLLINTEKIIVRKTPAISLYGNSPGGEIIFIEEEIRDSLIVKFRSYLGGETGDPLIHRFTKPELNLPNKNKIAPSGELAVSNKSGTFSYRLNAAYSGFFSTGSGNDDKISEINNYHFQKQDKQILLRGKIIRKTEAGEFTLNSSFNSHYGWVFTPFISGFAHIESYNYQISANAINVSGFLDILTGLNISNGELNESKYFLPAKFRINEYNLFTPFKISLSDKIKLILSPGIIITSGSNNKNGLENESQNILIKNITKNTYNLSISGSGTFGLAAIKPSVSLIKYFSYPIVFSGTLDFGARVYKNLNTEFSVGSVIRFPDLFQLYGNFIFHDFNGNSFNTSGNESLFLQRNNFGGVVAELIIPDLSLSTSAGIHYFNIQNPIEQINKEIINVKDDLFLPEGVYTNTAEKNILNSQLSLSFRLARVFKININHNYYYYHALNELPEHMVNLRIEALITKNLNVIVNFSFRDKTAWDNFAFNGMVNGDNPDSLPSFDNTNLVLQQYLDELFFFERITISLLIENLTNSRVLYLPDGNIISRAVTLLIQAEI